MLPLHHARVCTYKRTQNKKPKEELLTFELSERKDKKPFEIKKSFFRSELKYP
jgi:hypothetical protein